MSGSPDREASRPPVTVAVVSNGNAFSALMLRPLFEAPGVRMVGAVLVRVPPGRGGPGARLWRIARRTGLRYAIHKLATLAVPRAVGLASGRPAFLDGLASRHGVPWVSVGDANAGRARAFLREAAPDVLLSVSTPQRLDPDVLEIPARAAVNVHWGLLPEYAGIAPYFWVLRNGAVATGVTVHVMAPELDVGPILRQREVDVRPDDTALSLQLRLVGAGAEELVATMTDLPAALAGAREQDLSSRSYFSWPSAGDVRALSDRGRRLARTRDYRELARMIRGREGP